MPKAKKTCPCDPGKLFSECCSVFISGAEPAVTPEQLMRSRYSAYTMADADYIEKTMKGPAAVDFDKASTKQWAASVQWVRLKVLNAKPGPDENTGYVEFVAYFREDGAVQKIHEKSEFHREDGQWYYWSGVYSNKDQE